MLHIKTSDTEAIQPFLKKLYIPPADSHKGQNGRVLIIGGSKLFHAASLWAAEIATYFADMVHYISTQENEAIFTALKTTFRNGMIVSREVMSDYIREDDAILIGPGMVRGEITNSELIINNTQDVLHIEDEATYTHYLTKYLIHEFPDKKFIFDAGALQMMEPQWLLELKQKPIITPHQHEFENLFGISVIDMALDEKVAIVKQKAQEYRCVIVLKAVTDIITDGEHVIMIDGGNAGLTKGGSGDILAGLMASFYAKNDILTSAVLASYILKRSADELSEEKGLWYNMNDLIHNIPVILKKLLYN